MKNLFKYAASYWKAMIAIVLILVVQAYCDLSLPAYTSDIVNVGIQQGGIEDDVPRQKWKNCFCLYRKTINRR